MSPAPEREYEPPGEFIAEVVARLAKGAALAPVGAAVGSMIVAVSVMSRDSAGFFFVGLIIGTLFAAPLTCVVLPLARGPRRWGGPVLLVWLVVAGAVGGPLGVLVEMLPGTPKGAPYGGLLAALQQLWAGRGLFVLPASAAGAVCGLLFFRWTRPRRRPPADGRMLPGITGENPAASRPPER